MNINNTTTKTRWALGAILALAVVGPSTPAPAGQAPAKKPKPVSTDSNAQIYAKTYAEMAATLAKYDTNKNGKIDDPEKAAMPERDRKCFEITMNLWDVNQDGIIDKTDEAAMKAKNAKAERNYERLKRTRRPNEN